MSDDRRSLGRSRRRWCASPLARAAILAALLAITPIPVDVVSALAAEGDGSVSERPGGRANAPGQAQREQAGAGRESAPGQTQREQSGAGRESAPGQIQREQSGAGRESAPGQTQRGSADAGGDRATEAPGEQAGGGAGGQSPDRPGTGGTGAGRETPSPPSTPSRPSGSSGAGSGGTPGETQGGGSTEGSSAPESSRRETDPAPAPPSSSTSRSGASEGTGGGTPDGGGREGSTREVDGASASRPQEGSSDGSGQAGDASDEGAAGGRDSDRAEGQDGANPGGDGSGGAGAGSGGAGAGIALPESVGRTPAPSATSLDAPPATSDAAGRAAVADGSSVAAVAGPDAAETPAEGTAEDGVADARTATALGGAEETSAGNGPVRWNALSSLPPLAPPDDARSTAQWLLVSGLLTLLLLTAVLATRRQGPTLALGRRDGGTRGTGPARPTAGRGTEGPAAQRSRFAPSSSGPGVAPSGGPRGSALPQDVGSAGPGVAPSVDPGGSSVPQDAGAPGPSVTPTTEPAAVSMPPVTHPVARASEQRRSRSAVGTAGGFPASSTAVTAPVVRETADIARVGSDPLLDAMASIERRRSLTGRVALSTSAELSLESRIASLCLALMPVGAGLLALALGGRPAAGGPAALGAWAALVLAIVLTAAGVRSTSRLHDTRSRLLERFERSLDQRTRWTGQVLATLDRAQMHAAVGVDGVASLRRAVPDDPTHPVKRALDEREGGGDGTPTASRFLVELVEELGTDRASATTLGRRSEQVHAWHRLALEHRVALVRVRAVGPFLAFFVPATALLLVALSA